MVTIYSIPNCPYCNEIKEILTNEGVAYTDVNVDLPENEETYRKLTEITKSDQVPVIKVKNQLLVPNMSFQTIREAAEITKKLLG